VIHVLKNYSSHWDCEVQVRRLKLSGLKRIVDEERRRVLVHEASGRIRSTTAFRALNNKHKKDRTADHTHAVYSVKKNGELYSKPDSTHRSADEAQVEVDRMSKLNPGLKFKVVPLNKQSTSESRLSDHRRRVNEGLASEADPRLRNDVMNMLVRLVRGESLDGDDHAAVMAAKADGFVTVSGWDVTITPEGSAYVRAEWGMSETCRRNNRHSREIAEDDKARLRTIVNEEVRRVQLTDGRDTKYGPSDRAFAKAEPHLSRRYGFEVVKGRGNDSSDPSRGQEQSLGDAILDWTAENVNPKLRDAAMLRAHHAGQDACEVCGRALKPGHEVVEGIPIGPECIRRLRRDGVIGR
jgi:hypothetical protein